MSRSLLLSAFLCLVGMVTFAQSSDKGYTQQDCGDLCLATVYPEKAQVSPTEPIALVVDISNQSNKRIYILKESSAGKVWTDRARHTIYVAHFAYTKEREISLTGGYTSWDFYSPEFYCLDPGEKVKLRYTVGVGNEAGHWEVRALVSVLNDVKGLRGLAGPEVKLHMSEHDCILQSQPSEVIIRGG